MAASRPQSAITDSFKRQVLRDYGNITGRYNQCAHQAVGTASGLPLSKQADILSVADRGVKKRSDTGSDHDGMEFCRASHRFHPSQRLVDTLVAYSGQNNWRAIKTCNNPKHFELRDTIAHSSTPGCERGSALGALYKKRAVRHSVSLYCRDFLRGAFSLKNRGFADKQNSLLAAILGMEESLIQG